MGALPASYSGRKSFSFLLKDWLAMLTDVPHILMILCSTHYSIRNQVTDISFRILFDSIFSALISLPLDSTSPKLLKKSLTIFGT
jgi:hypothetical protein